MPVYDPTSAAKVNPTGPTSGQTYIDINYAAASGANLDYAYIYSSSAAKISLSGAITNNGTAITAGFTLSGTAIPIVTVATETGVMNLPLLLENTSGDRSRCLHLWSDAPDRVHRVPARVLGTVEMCRRRRGDDQHRAAAGRRRG